MRTGLMAQYREKRGGITRLPNCASPGRVGFTRLMRGCLDCASLCPFPQTRIHVIPKMTHAELVMGHPKRF